MTMPKVSQVSARNAIGSLMRKALGHQFDAPAATDLGSKAHLPKLSVLSGLQRRAIFAKSRPPK